MDFLVDTNVLIPAEPTAAGEVEPTTSVVVELLRLVRAGGGRVFLHPDAFTEIAGDGNETRRQTRQVLARKYPRLDSPPEISDELGAIFGRPAVGSHNYFDCRLLEAVRSGRADYLVSDDADLRRRARLAGLGDLVLTTSDALELARDVYEPAPAPPPLARAVSCAELDRADPLFDTLRVDYYGQFDEWFDKAVRERRRAWIVESQSGALAALAIVKEEDPGEHGLPGRLLKVSTFKVSSDHGGNRYGQLLLKALLEYAAAHDYDRIFVEAHDDKDELFAFLEQFGFNPLTVKKNEVDPVYAKTLHPSPAEAQGLDNLQYHVAFGPPDVRSKGVPAYIVPIRPEFHARLFPDVESQLALAVTPEPHGNAIRKAYLCRAKIKSLEPGDLLYFYRSVTSEVTVVGIAEDVARLSEPADIVRMAGKRTLYAHADVEEMTTSSGVLVIGFRQVKVMAPFVGLEELKKDGVLRAHPQTVTRLTEEAASWLAQKARL